MRSLHPVRGIACAFGFAHALAFSSTCVDAQCPRPARALPAVRKKLPEVERPPRAGRPPKTIDLTRPMLPPATGTVGGAPATPDDEPFRPQRPPPAFADETSWVYWWEFHRQHYLRAPAPERPASGPLPGHDDFFVRGRKKDVAGTTRIARASVRGSIVPTLASVLLREPAGTELTVASLLALAKAEAFRSVGDLRFATRVEDSLRSDDPVIRATAALALGLAKDPLDFDTLLEIAKDEDDARVRAFALHGLGAFVPALRTVDDLDAVRAACARVLKDATSESAEVCAGAVLTLGRLEAPTDDPRARRVLVRALHDLARFVERDELRRRAASAAQAHAPRAMTRLLDRLPDDAAVRGWLRDRLLRYARRASHDERGVRRGAILALGSIGESVESEEGSAYEVVRVLRSIASELRDPVSAHFALLALGQHPGGPAAKVLVETFDRPGRVRARPWAALGLGLLQRGGKAPRPDVRTRLIAAATGRDADPDVAAASAIALGLSAEPAEAVVEALRVVLQSDRPEEAPRGCAAVALAMLIGREAHEDVTTGFANATRRPWLERRMAFALGRLRIRRASQLLTSRLEEWPEPASLSAVAVGIGITDDASVVSHLVGLVADRARPQSLRAMAAAALGDLCDGEPTAWNARLVDGTNYLAPLPTLHDGRFGIFDLL